MFLRLLDFGLTEAWVYVIKPMFDSFATEPLGEVYLFKCSITSKQQALSEVTDKCLHLWE